MESKYSLVISQKAYEDLEENSKYISINLSNPQAAKKFLRDIKEALDNILLFPFSCPIKEIKLLKDKDIRVLIVGNYLAFYKVKDFKIIILRVKHSTSDYLV